MTPDKAKSAFEDSKSLKRDVIDKRFTLKVSSSSFRLSDVESFVYGPFMSRFWMMRKHTLMMVKRDLQNDPPFYAWNCITISIKNKWDINLIIKNEQVMSDFLKLLISATVSLNGVRGTGLKLKNMINDKCTQNLKGK